MADAEQQNIQVPADGDVQMASAEAEQAAELGYDEQAFEDEYGEEGQLEETEDDGRPLLGEDGRPYNPSDYLRKMQDEGLLAAGKTQPVKPPSAIWKVLDVPSGARLCYILKDHLHNDLQVVDKPSAIQAAVIADLVCCGEAVGRQMHKLDELSDRVASLSSQLRSVEQDLAAKVAQSQSIASRQLVSKIPEFDGKKGSDFKQWSSRVEEIARSLNMSMDQIARLAVTHLSGAARDSYEAINKPEDWEEIKKGLTPYFSTTDRELQAKKVWDTETMRNDLDPVALTNYTRVMRQAFDVMGKRREMNDLGAFNTYFARLPEALRNLVMVDAVVGDTTKSFHERAERLVEFATTRVLPLLKLAQNQPKSDGGFNKGFGGGQRKAGLAKGGAAGHDSQSARKRSRNDGGEASSFEGKLAYYDPQEPEKYDPSFKSLLIKEGKCLFCKRKGHTFRDCQLMPAEKKARILNNRKPKN